MTYSGVPGLVETKEEHGETTLVVDTPRLVEACTYLRDEQNLSGASRSHFLGYSLVYQLSPTLQLQSSLTNGLAWSGSSSSIDEYASAGISAAPAAANNAHLRETSVRARRYVGKTTDVIVTTPIALTTPYARLVLWIHHAGATTYA